MSAAAPWPLPPYRELGAVQVIATDIDGTLLRTGSPVSQATAAALDACVEAGVAVIPVTGRPIRWLKPLVDQIPHLPLTICSNGAVVYDLQAKRVLHARTIESDALAAFVQRRNDELPQALLAYETLDGLVVEDGFLDTPAGARVVKESASVLRGDWSTAHESQVVKLLVRLEGQMDSDALLAQVSPLAHTWMHASHSNSSNGLVELAAAGITKAATLEAHCAQNGVSASTVAAFGDMPNDLEMLTWAGLGFAMADAHDRVLDACAFRAPSIEDGGVGVIAQAIAQAKATSRP